MKKEIIETLVKARILRKREIDKGKIISLLNSAETIAEVAKKVPLDEDSATLIFREIYEPIRQLGDANWWLQGYEPTNHEISLESLKNLDIKEKLKLNFLERFKQIRHDANYRGFRVSVSQANEIMEFWDKCGKEIVHLLKKKLDS